MTHGGGWMRAEGAWGMDTEGCVGSPNTLGLVLLAGISSMLSLHSPPTGDAAVSNITGNRTSTAASAMTKAALPHGTHSNAQTWWKLW